MAARQSHRRPRPAHAGACGEILAEERKALPGAVSIRTRRRAGMQRPEIDLAIAQQAPDHVRVGWAALGWLAPGLGRPGLGGVFLRCLRVSGRRGNGLGATIAQRISASSTCAGPMD